MWSGLFYGLLVFATFNAVSYETHSTLRIVVMVGLATVLAGWHLMWRIPDRGPGNRLYFASATLMWAGLMLADPDFLILSLGIFAPLCYYDIRWGAVALVGTGGVWLWLESTDQGAIPWATVAAVVLVLATGLLVVAYFGTVVRQSRQRQELIDELRQTQADLAEVERRAGVMAERERLARDIHDTLTQGFASIVMLLEAATPSLPSGASGRRYAERALQTARENLVESRRLVWAMLPAALADVSLSHALRTLTADLAEDTGIEAETKVTGTPVELGVDQETAILRVAQEAVSNARKHAQATRVTVTLSHVDGGVVLDVQDDGVGFTSGEPRAGGAGLRTMSERAEALGGTLTVETSPGEGTTVAFELPIRESAPVTVPSHQQ
ncbi:MAG TPA: sensor histidine kinase [Acidimicrobiia bacterium]|nr:sensor histidine kinase [Acidimicrobiia bacterium]